MNDNEVTISVQAYNRLLEHEKTLSELRRTREAECELYDELFELRLKQGRFGGILQTRDGLQCFVRDARIDQLAHRNHPAIDGDPRRIFLMVNDRDPKTGVLVDDTNPPTREIRCYVETETRLKGVPVFQEIDPRKR